MTETLHGTQSCISCKTQLRVRCERRLNYRITSAILINIFLLLYSRCTFSWHSRVLVTELSRHCTTRESAVAGCCWQVQRRNNALKHSFAHTEIAKKRKKNERSRAKTFYFNYEFLFSTWISHHHANRVKNDAVIAFQQVEKWAKFAIVLFILFSSSSTTSLVVVVASPHHFLFFKPPGQGWSWLLLAFKDETRKFLTRRWERSSLRVFQRCFLFMWSRRRCVKIEGMWLIKACSDRMWKKKHTVQHIKFNSLISVYISQLFATQFWDMSLWISSGSGNNWSEELIYFHC